MRRFFLFPLAVLLVLGATRLAAQPESTLQPSGRRVTWSFDPVHGSMQPTPPAATVVSGRLDPEAAAGSNTAGGVYTGTINLTVTVKLISTLPKNAVVACTGAIGLEYTTMVQVSSLSLSVGAGALSSTEHVYATLSGSTATCNFTIPYSWTIPASSSSTIVTINGVGGAVGVEAEMADSTTGISLLRVLRTTTVEVVGPATIPANGTTTTLTASSVL